MKNYRHKAIDFSESDFRELESRLGGPVNTSRIFGVRYETWCKYRKGKLPLIESKRKLLE
ncbi:MAG: hypothetical protein WAW37_14220 [Syntrophobacteraceae bacterium]